jgi:hypothetical protein
MFEVLTFNCIYAFNANMFNSKDTMNTSITPAHIWALPAGTVIRADHGFYSHVALLSDEELFGERKVVEFSAAAGGFAELPYSAFANGRRVTVDGYPGSLPPSEVMRRATLKRAQPYSLLGFNCEHFVRYAHGVLVESPQLSKWVFMGGVFAVLAMTGRG